MAVGVGLGLSVFLSPYTSDRDRIKARLDALKGAFADADEQSWQFDVLARALSEYDIAEERMRPLIVSTVAICITSSIAASICLLLAVLYPTHEINPCVVHAAFWYYFFCYALCAWSVRTSSRELFKEVNACLAVALKSP
jgi:hypothetical protein